MKIALGAAQFGFKYGISNITGPTSKLEIKKILGLAVDNGIDLIDTAMSYGNSEIQLGLSDVSKFKIVTKVPILSPETIDISKWVREMVSLSIERLKIDQLHAVLIHNSNDLISSKGSILFQTLREMKKEGLINKVGISIYDPSEIDIVNNYKNLDLIQAPLNLMDRRLKSSGWLAKLHQAGIEIHVRSVFLQGFLLLKQNQLPLKFKKWQKNWDKWHSELKKKKVSAISACLSYPLSLPEVDKVIVGVNSFSQLKEILNISKKLSTNSDDWSFMISNDQMLINPTNWKEL